MFQIDREETARSRSQSVIMNAGRGQNIKYFPYAFTEHGAIQAANTLNSPRAVEMGVYVVSAFVKGCEILAFNSLRSSPRTALPRALLLPLDSRGNGHEDFRETFVRGLQRRGTRGSAPVRECGMS